MSMTPAQVTQQIRNSLRATEPELDTSAGSVTRKLIDAVAEAVAEAYADEHLLTYQYDIEAHSGEDLDDLVGLFGISRYSERRATGVITFERNTPAEHDIPIPIGTQAATSTEPPSIAATQTPSVLHQGETTVSVPARMVTAGTIGNVGSDTISRFVTPINGISGVTNSSPFAGGRDAESDRALRRRFKATVFQSLTGTRDFYLGLTLDDEDSTNANVLGAAKRYREQVQLVGGNATSGIPDATAIYPGSSIVGVNIDSGDILVEGVHYSFDANSNPPILTSLSGTAMPDGVYDLEFEYEPQASRNEVSNAITNRVDVYVHGDRPVTATDSLVFLLSRTFNNTPGDDFHRENFEREDGSHPVAGNYFLRYGFSPVTNPSITGFITIGDVTYEVGVNAFLVNDITVWGLAPTSYSGVELVASANGGPSAPANFSGATVEYVFNEVPRSVTSIIERHRLLTTDVLVHQAKPILLDMHFVIILDPGFDAVGVEDTLFSDLEVFIERVGFANILQTSDILGVVGDARGVDAVRFVTEGDNATNYAIQRVANDGETVIHTYADANGRAIDVISTDDELPVLNSVTVDVRAQNTYFEGQ